MAADLSAATPLLSLQGVWREFMVGDSPLAVLKHIDLEVAAGEIGLHFAEFLDEEFPDEHYQY